MQSQSFGIRLTALIPLALLALAVPTARAQTALPEVDLILVLAVDASGSITSTRWDLERQGYAQAFRSPDVLKAIQSGPVGAIAVSLVEWSAQFEETQVIPWRVISDLNSANQFSADLAELPRTYDSRTSISGGILFSGQLLVDAPFRTIRKVIDVSGDGPDNTSSAGIVSAADTQRLDEARDQIVGEGVTINGRPIFGDPHVVNLDGYYKANVIGGPGAFMVVADSFETFARAIERKLVLEIAANQVRARIEHTAARR
jgi:hypothetical protein